MLKTKLISLLLICSFLSVNAMEEETKQTVSVDYNPNTNSIIAIYHKIGDTSYSETTVIKSLSDGSFDTGKTLGKIDSWVTIHTDATPATVDELKARILEFEKKKRRK